MLKPETCVKPAFTVIGREGSTADGPDFVATLWAEANAHFAEVQDLALRDENGDFVGFWGAMSDLSRSFAPWEDNFTRGLYLAGVECAADAVPPAGWTRWRIPGFEFLRVKSEGMATFTEMMAWMEEHGLSLAGAALDFTCPKTGENYLFCPIRRL